jgi:hypothetical protein
MSFFLFDITWHKTGTKAPEKDEARKRIWIGINVVELEGGFHTTGKLRH